MGVSLTEGIRNYIKAKMVRYANITYSSPSEALKGKRIIVTGGASGIGLAMAKRFVEEGASVLIAGRNEENLEQQSREMGCHALPLDLTKVETFSNFVKQAAEKLGGIDCLVNNAGVSLHEWAFMAVKPEGFDKQIATNLKGPFFLTQKVIINMLKNKIQGQVLFISSETGEMADIRPYGLTKAAINSLVQGLAYLYIEQGIRVNAIAPGVTATKMAGYKDQNINCTFNPNGRAYLPEEIAEVAAFLLSDVSGSISGQIITCNNGKSINARWKI